MFSESKSDAFDTAAGAGLTVASVWDGMARVAWFVSVDPADIRSQIMRSVAHSIDGLSR